MPPGRSSSTWTRNPLTGLLVAAVAIRLITLYSLGSVADARGLTPWEWGWESAALGDAWLSRGVYGDPFGVETGPSGWLTPPYPLFLAGLFHIFGGVNESSALTLFLIQTLVSALTCILVVQLGRDMKTPRAGLAAGWLLAFHPLSIWLAVVRVWDTTFMALALVTLLLAITRAGPRPSMKQAAGIGLLYGLVILLNPAPLTLAPLLAFYYAAGPARESLIRLGAILVCATLVTLPWMARNLSVLGSPGLRTNFGIELYSGNHENASGRVSMNLHPASPENTDEYSELGEVAYARACHEKAIGWIIDHPGTFLQLSLQRVRLFWIGEDPRLDPRESRGVGSHHDPHAWIKWGVFMCSGILGLLGAALVRQRSKESWLVIGTLALFPIPYYMTHVSERYRYPIEPIVLLAACWWLERRRSEKA